MSLYVVGSLNLVLLKVSPPLFGTRFWFLLFLLISTLEVVLVASWILVNFNLVFVN